jgi:hypothetical protein
MNSALLFRFDLGPVQDQEPLRLVLLRILDMTDHYGIRANWELADPCGEYAAVAAILGTPGQELGISGAASLLLCETLALAGPGWSVFDMFRIQSVLAHLDRCARTQRTCVIRVDLSAVQPHSPLGGLKKIFGRFAWLRDQDRMVSLTASEYERRAQAVAGSSFTISPTNDFASPNNISVRSM